MADIIHNTDNLTVIGVDPGSRITGYGIIQRRNRNLHLVDFGMIRLDSNMSIPERLVRFADRFSEIIQKYAIGVLAIEDVFAAKNIQSVLKLGQVRGVAMMIAAKNRLKIAEYAPATVKQNVVGYGRASKKQVQYIIQKTFKLQKMPASDTADALAVGLCYLYTDRFKSKAKQLR